jgi:phosphoribosylpyrophosphate synthetase
MASKSGSLQDEREEGGRGASNYIVYSSESSSYLADAIAQQLGVPRGQVERKTFLGGEKYYRIEFEERYELVGKVSHRL